MITDIIGAIGNSYAQYRAGQEATRARKNFGKGMRENFTGEQGDLDAYLKGDMYKNYLDSDMARSTLKTVQDQLRENAQRIQGGVATTGGTPEAAIGAQTAGANQYADIINRLYAHGTNYQTDARNRYMQGLQGLYGAKRGFEKDRYSIGMGISQGWMNQGQNFQEGMNQIGDALDEDALLIMKMVGGV